MAFIADWDFVGEVEAKRIRGAVEMSEYFIRHFVAPPHARSNWALGLGLTMFMVGPDIGPFAPMNRRVLLNSGAAQAIEAPMDAHLLGARITRLRQNGCLAEMAQAGWGHREINGFARIAAFLVSKYGII